MRKFGLIGYPLSHSFSPGYFNNKFKENGITDACYDLYPILRIDYLENIKGLSGLNVTIPYKEKVLDYMDDLSDEARLVGAVNTIHYTDGMRVGHNTDVYGFEKSLLGVIGDQLPNQALVLGTGGAAKAVWFVLEKLNIPFLNISRTSGDLIYKEVTRNHIKESHLIVNTTPLGMSPHTNKCPKIPYEAISSKHILFDLIYNPEKTLFLRNGADQGATVKNGLEMLELQADKAWEIWNTN